MGHIVKYYKKILATTQKTKIGLLGRSKWNLTNTLKKMTLRDTWKTMNKLKKNENKRCEYGRRKQS